MLLAKINSMLFTLKKWKKAVWGLLIMWKFAKKKMKIPAIM